jgi:hypothetical protein
VKTKKRTKKVAKDSVTVVDWHHAGSTSDWRDKRTGCAISLSERSDSSDGPTLVIYDGDSSWLHIHGEGLVSFLASIKAAK